MMEQDQGMAQEDDQQMQTAQDAAGEECFDPSTCCDPMEQVMIAAMRRVLRPEQAPACLYEKLRGTLDRCCGQTEHTVIRHTTIIRYRTSQQD